VAEVAVVQQVMVLLVALELLLSLTQEVKEV
jgi:hypothetical protein